MAATDHRRELQLDSQPLAQSHSPLCSDKALVDVARSLTARLNVQQTCEAVLGAVERICHARSSWVLVHDSATDELVTIASRGPDATTYANARIPIIRRTISGLVFHGREPIFIPDVQAENRWHDPLRVQRSGLRAVFVMPLVVEGTSIGVLGLDSPLFSAASPPAPSYWECLQAIAAQAAIGLRNACLFESLEADRARLLRLVEDCRHRRNDVGNLRREMRGTHASDGVVGHSRAFREVLAQVRLVAPADSTVVLIGETGTGKELVARMIHDDSRRRTHPFIAVNCAALPESLVESELFGHEKGAFTGALARTAGKFELANRGTLLLDEISDLPAAAQAKLLRVLQEREVQRVGGAKPEPVNVRVIAATNNDLAGCIHSGAFRADLYYRLSVFPIYLPALRERREDIPHLVTAFVQRFAERQHKAAPILAPGVLETMVGYDWPGNVRELQNVVERAVILCRDGVIAQDVIAVANSVDSRPAASVASAPSRPSTAPPTQNVVPFSEAERRAILRALELTGWRVSGASGAADILGLKSTTLHAKMKKLGIRRPSAAAAADQ